MSVLQSLAYRQSKIQQSTQEERQVMNKFEVVVISEARGKVKHIVKARSASSARKKIEKAYSNASMRIVSVEKVN